jgi:CBS domain-containing protein
VACRFIGARLGRSLAPPSVDPSLRAARSKQRVKRKLEPKVSMKVREIQTKDPEVIRPEAMICEAAQKMAEHDIGMLPVCDGERLVGAITDRDLVIRGMAKGYDPLKTKVKDVMSPGICYCFEDDNLEEVARSMEEKQIRRMPILNSGKRLVGIVSLGDLAVRSKNRDLTEEVLEHVSQPA